MVCRPPPPHRPQARWQRDASAVTPLTPRVPHRAVHRHRSDGGGADDGGHRWGRARVLGAGSGRTGARAGMGWGWSKVVPRKRGLAARAGAGDVVLAERTTGSGLGCRGRNRVKPSCFPSGPCRGGSDAGSISSSSTAPTSLPTGASITSAPTTTTSAASSPGI